MKASLPAIPLLIILALWFYTGFGETSFGVDHNSGDLGIVLFEGSAIFHINYYGPFEWGAIEHYFILEPYRSFSFREEIAGFFYIGTSHPSFEPGFAISIPFWILVLIATAIPVFWLTKSVHRIGPNKSAIASPIPPRVD